MDMETMLAFIGQLVESTVTARFEIELRAAVVHRSPEYGQAGIYQEHYDNPWRQMQQKRKQDDVQKEEEKHRIKDEKILLAKDMDLPKPETKTCDEIIVDMEQLIHEFKNEKDINEREETTVYMQQRINESRTHGLEFEKEWDSADSEASAVPSPIFEAGIFNGCEPGDADMLFQRNRRWRSWRTWM